MDRFNLKNTKKNTDNNEHMNNISTKQGSITMLNMKHYKSGTKAKEKTTPSNKQIEDDIDNTEYVILEKPKNSNTEETDANMNNKEKRVSLKEIDESNLPPKEWSKESIEKKLKLLDMVYAKEQNSIINKDNKINNTKEQKEVEQTQSNQTKIDIKKPLEQEEQEEEIELQSPSYKRGKKEIALDNLDDYDMSEDSVEYKKNTSLGSIEHDYDTMSVGSIEDQDTTSIDDDYDMSLDNIEDEETTISSGSTQYEQPLDNVYESFSDNNTVVTKEINEELEEEKPKLEVETETEPEIKQKKYKIFKNENMIDEPNYIETYCTKLGYIFDDNEVDIINFLGNTETVLYRKIKIIDKNLFYINFAISKVLYLDALVMIDENNNESAKILLEEIALSSVDINFSNKSLNKLKEILIKENNETQIQKVINKMCLKEKETLNLIYNLKFLVYNL